MDSFLGILDPVLRLKTRWKPPMIDRLIELSLRNRFLVVALWIGIAGWGLWAMLRAPIMRFLT